MVAGTVGPHDKKALGCMTVLCMTYWTQYMFLDVDDAATGSVGAKVGTSVAAATGGAGSTDAAVAALQLLLLASLLAATFASRSWHTYRTWLVAALRLAAFAPVLLAATTQQNLTREPGDLGLPDLLPLMLGSRAVRLWLLSTALPLDLLPHLLVQTACLAATMAPTINRQACSLPLLGHGAMEQGIAAFHAVMHGGTLGILPPGHPEGGRLRQCAAALDFLALWMGWLLPTYLAARGQARRAAALSDGPHLSPSSTLSSMGSMDSRAGGLSAQGGKQAPYDDGSRHAPVVPLPADRAGLSQQRAQGSWRQLSTALPGWMLTNVFLADGLSGQDWLAWYVWTVMCWLAATVTALATA